MKKIEQESEKKIRQAWVTNKQKTIKIKQINKQPEREREQKYRNISDDKIAILTLYIFTLTHSFIHRLTYRILIHPGRFFGSSIDTHTHTNTHRKKNWFKLVFLFILEQ